MRRKESSGQHKQQHRRGATANTRPHYNLRGRKITWMCWIQLLEVNAQAGITTSQPPQPTKIKMKENNEKIFSLFREQIKIRPLGEIHFAHPPAQFSNHSVISGTVVVDHCRFGRGAAPHGQLRRDLRRHGGPFAANLRKGCSCKPMQVSCNPCPPPSVARPCTGHSPQL